MSPGSWGRLDVSSTDTASRKRRENPSHDKVAARQVRCAAGHAHNYAWRNCPFAKDLRRLFAAGFLQPMTPTTAPLVFATDLYGPMRDDLCRQGSYDAGTLDRRTF